MGHSIIPPSSAHIWGKPEGCTGWVNMALKYPENEDSEQSKDGTAAHELAAIMVDSTARARTGFPKRGDTIGSFAENGQLITEEMYESAEMYADDIDTVMQSTGVFGGTQFGTEVKVQAPHIHELSEGTLDCFIWDAKAGVLYVWDFKFGMRLVEIFENWQLINYTAGLFNLLDIDGYADQHITVCMRVVQPRGFHKNGPVREWKVTASDLRTHFNVLHNNANKALGPNPELLTGKHCRDCSARHACPAAMRAGISLYEVAMDVDTQELSTEALGLQLLILDRAASQIKYLKEGLTEQARVKIKQGERVPFWNIEPTFGRLKWAKPIKQIISMGGHLGVELKKEDAVITPTQAKKLGLDENLVEQWSERPSNGVKLEPDDGSKARRIFTQQEV